MPQIFKRLADRIVWLAAPFNNPDWAYTVLAPVNEAFDEAAAGLNITLSELVSSPDLVYILNNHLLAYPLTVSSLPLRHRNLKTSQNVI